MKIKVLKRILITLGIFLTLVLITNEVVYHMNIPDEFEDSNWTGKWSSSEFTLVSGKILTSISKPIIENSEFISPTLLYYNIWSLYKPGQTKVVEMSGSFGGDYFVGNNELDDQNLQNSTPFKLNLFKAKIIFKNGQVIEYTGEKRKDDKGIFGNYISKSPTDSGDFELSME